MSVRIVSLMNKSELISRIAAAKGISEKHARDIVNTVFDTIIDVLQEEERINIRGFGAFEVREHKEKIGRNPHTGERILLAPRSTVVFSVSRTLRKSFDL